ncbi:hypothetical protein VNO77_20192 [Canavalia gladiata]|uniref:Uncharacterized protein n=1 Tax=Canavalia gladiata TaxID=3824 RepID=A0AAN9LNT5_CANGL
MFEEASWRPQKLDRGQKVQGAPNTIVKFTPSLTPRHAGRSQALKIMRSYVVGGWLDLKPWCSICLLCRQKAKPKKVLLRRAWDLLFQHLQAPSLNTYCRCPRDVSKLDELTLHNQILEHDDLFIEHNLSLTEALCGFQFAVIHLSDRQLLIKSDLGEVIKPDQYINNERMPQHNRPFMKGHLYIQIPALGLAKLIFRNAKFKLKAWLSDQLVVTAIRSLGLIPTRCNFVLNALTG